jgi:hypothetical protein
MRLVGLGVMTLLTLMIHNGVKFGLGRVFPLHSNIFAQGGSGLAFNPSFGCSQTPIVLAFLWGSMLSDTALQSVGFYKQAKAGVALQILLTTFIGCLWMMSGALVQGMTPECQKDSNLLQWVLFTTVILFVSGRNALKILSDKDETDETDETTNENEQEYEDPDYDPDQDQNSPEPREEYDSGSDNDQDGQDNEGHVNDDKQEKDPNIQENKAAAPASDACAAVVSPGSDTKLVDSKVDSKIDSKICSQCN